MLLGATHEILIASESTLLLYDAVFASSDSDRQFLRRTLLQKNEQPATLLSHDSCNIKPNYRNLLQPNEAPAC